MHRPGGLGDLTQECIYGAHLFKSNNRNLLAINASEEIMKTQGYWSTMDTKAGPFTAIVDDEGAVLSSGWTSSIADLTPQISPKLLPLELQEKTELGKISLAIRQYHEGDLTAPDSIEVKQVS